MRKFLDRLFSSADDLFHHLLSPRDEAWQDELDGLSDAVSLFRKHYVTDIHAPFIDPAFVLLKIEAQPGSALWAAASKTVSVANLMSVLVGMVSIEEEVQEDALHVLESWDSAFPTSFLPENGIVLPDYTLDQALNIRTQVFIARVQNLHSRGVTDIDYLGELTKTFTCGGTSAEQLLALIEDDDISVEFRPIPTFDMGSENTDSLRLISRIRAIYEYKSDLERLQTSFPFLSFLKDFGEYIQHAYARIKEAMEHQGAVPRVPAIFEAAAQSQIASQLESDAALAQPRQAYDSPRPPRSFLTS